MLRGKGFTLLEVLIGAVLVIIGAGSIGITVISARRFLKDTEDKSRAMRLASAKIEECLAGGYSALEAPSLSSADEDGLNWSVRVTAETASGSKASIPYKKAEAVVSYAVDRGSGGINSIRNIRLTNILPYPQVHTRSQDVFCSDEASGCPEVPPDKGTNSCGLDNEDPEEGQYREVAGDARLRVSFDYAVTTNIKAAYTISIRADEADNAGVFGKLDSLDTIYSTFFLDGKLMPSPKVARSPIMSQPTFNSIITVIKDVSPGHHTLSVAWVKRTADCSSNSAGKIWLINGSLSIIATEVE